MVGVTRRLTGLPIGQILMPCFLFCVACGAGRTPLMDTGVAARGADGDNQPSHDGGLLASTPGRVRCGLITCSYGEQCCLRQEGRPGSDGCAPLNGTCHGPARRVCDETADCAPGEICCWAVLSSPPPSIGSYCIPSMDGETNCNRNDFVACGSNDECRAVGAPDCVAQQCRADILQSCGLMPSSYCPP